MEKTRKNDKKQKKTVKYKALWLVLAVLFLIGIATGDGADKTSSKKDTTTRQSETKNGKSNTSKEDTDKVVSKETQNAESEIQSETKEQDTDEAQSDEAEKTETKKSEDTTTKENDVEAQTKKIQKSGNEQDSKLEVHFLDVGQGDSTLIACDGKYMLIDAGENSEGQEVADYLAYQKIEKLDYIICTHGDSDHSGGLDVVLASVKCENMIISAEDKTTATYLEVLEAVEKEGCKVISPKVGTEYTLGGAKFTIYSPAMDYEDSNENSIVIRLVHGKNSFLFTGDAGELAEKHMVRNDINLKSDVYKAGHHGSSTSSSEEFVNKVKPTYAIISCGEDNSYGHPHAEVLNRFRAMGVQVFRTDEQGTIVARSDKEKITFNMSPSDTWKAGEKTQNASSSSNKTSKKQNSTSNKTQSSAIDKVSQSNDKASDVTTYICNANTKKFHLPGCNSVSRMSEENTIYSTDTKEELINQGYVACKSCMD